MKTPLSLVFLWLSLYSFAQEAPFHPKQFIAKFKSSVPLEYSDQDLIVRQAELESLHTRWRVQRIERLYKGQAKHRRLLDTDRLAVFHFQDSLDIPSAIQAYQATGLFEYVEPDYIGYTTGVEDLTPGESLFSIQWGLRNDGTFNANNLSSTDYDMAPSKAGADIDMEAAWDITTGNPNTVIAILDSGCRLQHPELAGRLWINPIDENNNGQDEDNNGYPDDESGWDFVNLDNTPFDDLGHGTNITGIIAATGNNNIGYAGINWKAKVMIGKVLNSNNSGTYSDFIEGVLYSVDNGADVINMSLSGLGNSFAFNEACDYAAANHVIIVASMANEDNDTPFYPAAFDATIAVGSTDANDHRTNPFFWDAASGSNYGNHIDLVAPGNFIYGLSSQSNTSYNTYWGGTSQAAPAVAGVVSLMKGLDPTLSLEEIRTILWETAEDQVGKSFEDTSGWDQFHGAGRLNAKRALEALTSMVNVAEVLTETFFAQLSPNPVVSNGQLQLEITEAIEFPVQYTLMDASGKVLRDQILEHGGEVHLLSAPAQTGIYLLKIETADNIFQTLRFIVK